jgi:hypothetical protein
MAAPFKPAAPLDAFAIVGVEGLISTHLIHAHECNARESADQTNAFKRRPDDPDRVRVVRVRIVPVNEAQN